MGENGASVQRGVDLPPRFHYRMPVAPHTHAALTQLQEKLEAEFGPRIWFQPNQTEVTPFFSDETTHADLRTFLAQELNAEKAGITVYDQSDCIDLCPTGLDKGSGLAFLCTRMGWELSETAAVGDGVNDEPMLRSRRLFHRDRPAARNWSAVHRSHHSGCHYIPAHFVSKMGKRLRKSEGRFFIFCVCCIRPCNICSALHSQCRAFFQKP